MARVLVACEFSGTVRDAFAALGHDAWSCDILPSESPGNHIEGCVLSVLDQDWDLIVAHPPCTYLSYAGTRHWNNPGRAEKREDALAFFMKCYNAPARRVAVENPVGYANTVFRKPDQVIDPYFFGDRERKRTALWLRNLPPLIHVRSDDLISIATHCPPPEPKYFLYNGKAVHWCAAQSGAKDRQKKRSRFWPGIANAMAQQWGALL